MRVLIVDDNELSLALLKKPLIEAGFEIETATNGREALQLMRQSENRLVVSDWEMPEMSGIELCHAIRAEEFETYIYFILLTSHNTPEEKVIGLSAGADDFITKPFNPAELIARLQIGERVLALDTRDVLLFAMAKLAESRDPDTGEHLERVRAYSRGLVQRLATIKRFQKEIGAGYIRHIFLTSPLHDIGKVGIPDRVLLKPDRLDRQEFEIMKTHTTMGATTLDAAVRQYPTTRFLQMARDIALTHHERFDGRGYPSGLKGDEIPLSGRIVALADVYDALTSKRVYKQAMSHVTACEVIKNESGKQFDPDLVDAFLENQDMFIRIRDRFRRPAEHAADISEKDLQPAVDSD